MMMLMMMMAIADADADADARARSSRSMPMLMLIPMLIPMAQWLNAQYSVPDADDADADAFVSPCSAAVSPQSSLLIVVLLFSLSLTSVLFWKDFSLFGNSPAPKFGSFSLNAHVF